MKQFSVCVREVCNVYFTVFLETEEEDKDLIEMELNGMDRSEWDENGFQVIEADITNIEEI